eukprot:2949893-Karenia_brevis.AAC.1
MCMLGVLGLPVDVISFSAAISAFVGSGRWQCVESLFCDMHKRGLLLNVISFSAAMFHEMPKRGVPPAVITFSAAISACVKGGQWQRVAPLLDEMCTPGLPHDAISFNAATSACVT